MQRRALHILGERIFLGDSALAHDAGHGRGLRQPLLLDQPFERTVTAPAGRNLEHAGLDAFGVENRPDVQALQERAPGDVLGQLFDRDAGLHAPNIRLAEHQLVEGDVARGAESDLLNRTSHIDSLRDGRPGDFLSTSNPSRKPAQPSYSLQSRAADPESRRNVSTDDRLYVSARAHHAASCSSSVEAATGNGSAGS